ncbi:YigZ family protein [Streptococcus macacae]|uniref:YigZ family protein n=1 Tax=Streptococcus macacae NCTC 11558 TaxID=764298 RepID=G5JY36_9STRE|nr:YigZ family protein [Streptococcus macacae]EHJ51792.1 YigZ family protein [Streptococcus macacae NCTC 11558]SUN77953.1 FIG000605: protein co-occurring with transport systems (COG1739) [Streptococcus macacae NCTC 11558]
MNYKTIAKDGITEEIIKKSRFICQSKRIFSEEEGRSFISQIKKEHYKASHSCSAMIIGENSNIKRSSDDGEPSGTAGIPMLSVLEKNQLTNLIVVTTRYFGGIKLGTGGLIRAYSGSVANNLKTLGLINVKKQSGIEIELTYPQYQTFGNFLNKYHLTEYSSDFSVNVKTTIYVDKSDIETILNRLTEFYQGKVNTRLVGSKIIELPVI